MSEHPGQVERGTIIIRDFEDNERKIRVAVKMKSGNPVIRYIYSQNLDIWYRSHQWTHLIWEDRGFVFVPD